LFNLFARTERHYHYIKLWWIFGLLGYGSKTNVIQNMRTYKSIYDDLCADTGAKYTLKELLRIFERESDWLGKTEQLIKLRELVIEITGIRPGTCHGCNLDVLQNMLRFLNKYESENPINPIQNEPDSNGGVRHRRKSKK
jgi:hypothetical protein